MPNQFIITEKKNKARWLAHFNVRQCWNHLSEFPLCFRGMLDRPVNSNHSSLFIFHENTICHLYCMSDLHCFSTALALILQPLCIWAAWWDQSRTSHRVFHEELFAGKCGENGSCSCFCLCGGLRATSTWPQLVWVWLGDLVPWCSLPVSYTSVKHRSLVLFAAPFGAPGNLDKGLERELKFISRPWGCFSSESWLPARLGYHTESPGWVNWVNPFERLDNTFQTQHVPVPPCFSQENHCSPAHQALSPEMIVPLIRDVSLLFPCSFYKYLPYTPFVSFVILPWKLALIVSVTQSKQRWAAAKSQVLG